MATLPPAVLGIITDLAKSNRMLSKANKGLSKQLTLAQPPPPAPQAPLLPPPPVTVMALPSLAHHHHDMQFVDKCGMFSIQAAEGCDAERASALEKLELLLDGCTDENLQLAYTASVHLLRGLIRAARGGGVARMYAFAILTHLSAAGDNSKEMVKRQDLFAILVDTINSSTDETRNQSLMIVFDMAVVKSFRRIVFRTPGLVAAVLGAAEDEESCEVSWDVLKVLSYDNEANLVDMYSGAVLEELVAATNTTHHPVEALASCLIILHNLSTCESVSEMDLLGVEFLADGLFELVAHDNPTIRCEALGVFAVLILDPDQKSTLLEDGRLAQVVVQYATDSAPSRARTIASDIWKDIKLPRSGSKRSYVQEVPEVDYEVEEIVGTGFVQVKKKKMEEGEGWELVPGVGSCSFSSSSSQSSKEDSSKEDGSADSEDDRKPPAQKPPSNMAPPSSLPPRVNRRGTIVIDGTSTGGYDPTAFVEANDSASDDSDEEDYTNAIPEAKAGPRRMSSTMSARNMTNEDQEKGEKAVEYIQNMLASQGSSRRRSVDWHAMPKSSEFNDGDETKDHKPSADHQPYQRAKKWYDKLDDIGMACPMLDKYLKRDPDVDYDRYKPTALKAACAFSAWEVQNWTLANCIFFLGTLKFPDDDTERYRRHFRNLMNPSGKHILMFNRMEKLLDAGWETEHAIVLVGVVKAWYGEFEIVGNPVEQPNVYIPDFGSLYDADEIARTTGVGDCYGQLVVLGYKEYVASEGSGQLQPRGEKNQKFVLSRREEANGIRKDRVVVSEEGDVLKTELCTHTTTMRVMEPSRADRPPPKPKVVVTEYIPDAAADMYQLGRLQVRQNDFVVKGPLTKNDRGQFCGPISRYAARVMCSRLPPYEAFVCAAGFDSKRDIFLSEVAPKWKVEGESDESGDAWDAVTTFGMRVWQPSEKKWVEVSVNGFMHEVRIHDDVGGERIGTDKCKLEHGSIIDLSGVQLIFQDFEHMKQNKPSEVTMEEFYGEFNDMRVQCPVNLSTIRYSHGSSFGGGGTPTNYAMARKKAEPKSPSNKEGFKSKGKVGKADMVGAGKKLKYDVDGNVLRTKRGDGKDLMRRGFDFKVDSNGDEWRDDAAGGGDGDDSDGDDSDDDDDDDEEEESDNEFFGEGEWTAGVFPGCGHIVTFSAEMQRGLQNCPMCREECQLQMLSIAYEPAITGADTSPTHVFNPCGCAASLLCVDFWSDLKMPHNAHPGYTNCPICPFCASVLEVNKATGKMASKLITGHEVKINRKGEVESHTQAKLE